MIPNEQALHFLYGFVNIAEIFIIIILFYFGRKIQNLEKKGTAKKRIMRLEQYEVVVFIVLIIFQVFTTWYILQP